MVPLIGIVLVVLLLSTGIFFGQNLIGDRSREVLRESQNSDVSSEEPSRTCSGQPVPESTEGPYYKENSPEKSDFSADGESGEKFELSGYVLDTDCKPIANAWLDFWQADGEGSYDNEGYRYRGHQFSDENGRYTLTTVIPSEYPGRTPHIHVKIRASTEAPVITTQLYFPGVVSNESDSIFNERMVINVDRGEAGSSGSFDFVIEK